MIVAEGPLGFDVADLIVLRTGLDSLILAADFRPALLAVPGLPSGIAAVFRDWVASSFRGPEDCRARYMVRVDDLAADRLQQLGIGCPERERRVHRRGRSLARNAFAIVGYRAAGVPYAMSLAMRDDILTILTRTWAARQDCRRRRVGPGPPSRQMADTRATFIAYGHVDSIMRTNGVPPVPVEALLGRHGYGWQLTPEGQHS